MPGYIAFFSHDTLRIFLYRRLGSRCRVSLFLPRPLAITDA